MVVMPSCLLDTITFAYIHTCSMMVIELSTEDTGNGLPIFKMMRVGFSL